MYSGLFCLDKYILLYMCYICVTGYSNNHCKSWRKNRHPTWRYTRKQDRVWKLTNPRSLMLACVLCIQEWTYVKIPCWYAILVQWLLLHYAMSGIHEDQGYATLYWWWTYWFNWTIVNSLLTCYINTVVIRDSARPDTCNSHCAQKPL